MAGRTGGAVSLAVGMAQIFSELPGMRGLMDYWYHFAIMFEALFILTVIDAGTRVGAVPGRRVPRPRLRAVRAARLGRRASIITTLIVVVGWAYFIWTGNISTIWPMFGIANQLLAAVALAVGTTILINIGRARYAWVTLVPLSVPHRHDAHGRIPDRQEQVPADGHRRAHPAALQGTLQRR